MTPSTRKEIYLNKIATGEGTIPTPATREEMYLAKIAGEEVEVPTPATRVEVYLYKIAGGSIIIPTPATRLEMFLAAASGMPVSIPVPATREEILWDYIINGINPQMITGVPPINFTANGKPLISWSMLGNGQQNGTPTPDNPVMPTFCGVRTGNLFDMSFYKGISRITVSGTKATGTCDRFFNVRLSIPAELYGQELTWSAYIKRPDNPNTVRLQTIDGSVYKYGNDIAGKGRSTVSFTATSTIRLYVNYANTGTDTIELSDITLNLGSTALPYEPYGYKLPITNAGQTVPVYLGQTQTVRKIKCVDLGTLTYTKTASGNFSATLGDGKVVGNSEIAPAICSHFKVVSANNYGSTPYSVCASINNQSYISMNKTGFEEMTVTEFKAAMSGVLLWYALATPETAIVNEPLMKIGDYADELSSVDAGVSIPTVNGSNTLTVETDLQPLSMTITGYIAESQTMAAAKIMARASGMDVNDKELESLSKKELNSILKGAVKSGG